MIELNKRDKIMSYVFSHAFIPLAILLILSRRLNLNPRNILYLSFFGIFPDLDVVFRHRYTFHNIFILMIPILAFIFIRDYREIIGIIFFYLLSHLILDIFNGGIVALYPFYNGIFFINAEILSNFNVDNIMFILNYGIKRDFINVSNSENGYGIVSSENFGMIILIFIIVSWSFIIKNRIKKRE